MTVLFFGVLGSVSFLTAWMAYWIYRRLPDYWLCEYGEAPSEIHRPEHRCTNSKRILFLLTAVVWIPLLSVFLGKPEGILDSGYGEWTELLYMMLMSLILLPSVLSDLDYLIIPDQICAAAAAAAVLKGGLMDGFSGVTDAAAGGLTCGVLAWISAAVPSLLTESESMGMGDVKLLTACGAAAAASAEEGSGYMAGISVFSGAVLMSAVWFSLLLLLGKTCCGDARPMAPWIVFSTLMSMAWF